MRHSGVSKLGRSCESFSLLAPISAGMSSRPHLKLWRLDEYLPFRSAILDLVEPPNSRVASSCPLFCRRFRRSTQPNFKIALILLILTIVTMCYAATPGSIFTRCLGQRPPTFRLSAHLILLLLAFFLHHCDLKITSSGLLLLLAVSALGRASQSRSLVAHCKTCSSLSFGPLLLDLRAMALDRSTGNLQHVSEMMNARVLVGNREAALHHIWRH